MKNEEAKGNVWDLLLIMCPAIFLSNLGPILYPGIPSAAAAAIFAAMGVALGFGLSALLMSRSKNIKIGAVVTLFVAFLLVAFMSRKKATPLSEEENVVYSSCPVCGYKGIMEEVNKECEVCYVEVSESFRKAEGYVSIADLIENEQLIFFATEKDFTLFTPKEYIEDEDYRYEKDSTWQPVVTQEQVDALIVELKVYEDSLKNTMLESESANNTD